MSTTQTQLGVVQAIQQEKQLLVEAYNKLAQEVSQLKAQLAELALVRNRNQELSAQVERLGQHLARETLARQNAERALAEALVKLGQNSKSDATLPGQPAGPAATFSGSKRAATAPQSAVLPSLDPTLPRADSDQFSESSSEIEQVANPFLVTRSLLGDLAKPGTGKVSSAVNETLAGMKRSLPYFIRHTSSPEVLEALCQQIDFVASETAKSGILNLYQITTALRLLLHDLRSTESLINTPNLRSIEHAIDFIFHLLGSERFRKLKDLAPARILAVDDEALVLEVLANQMKSIELDLRATSSSSQAIPLLKRQRYNLLLLDIAMDELNGFDLCSQIRSLPYYSRTPIVFLTGMKTLDMRAQSSLVGGNDFISKPFHASEIKLKAIYWALKDQMDAL